MALDLARRIRRLGVEPELLHFDAPSGPAGEDVDPGNVPWSSIERLADVPAFLRSADMLAVVSHHEAALAELAGHPQARKALGHRARARAVDFSSIREWGDHVALWTAGSK